MSEPQHAVLMFGKVCTICGVSTRAKLDPFLHARLCSSCRDEHLIEISRWANPVLTEDVLVDHSKCIGVKVKSAPHPRGARPVFSLVQSVNEVLEKRERYFMDDDMSKTFEWRDARLLQVAELRKVRHGAQLKGLLDWVKASREGELDNMRKQRQDTIRERLYLLGWTDRDRPQFLPPGSTEWRALVDSPKPLTARIWNIILLKLVFLLERNRARLDEREKARRRHQRRFCINDFLDELYHSNHAIQPFALLEDYELKQLFPNIGFIITWECIADLSDQEITVEEVIEQLVARNDPILKGISDWNNKLDDELLEKLGESDMVDMRDVQVTVSVRASNIEPGWDLSKNQKILLHAGSVFSLDDEDRNRFFLLGYSRSGDISRYYPHLITDQYRFFSEKYANVCPFYTDIVLSGYKRNLLAEKVIKRFLDVIAIPDVTRITSSHGLSFSAWKMCCQDTRDEQHYI
ncbi:valine-tRNA ligase [Ceratobasidium sp. AG-Ba]|nr:valine-tRNA ligase [Ceratobasidium sp. AG-Ba]